MPGAAASKTSLWTTTPARVSTVSVGGASVNLTTRSPARTRDSDDDARDCVIVRPSFSATSSPVTGNGSAAPL